jgi:hypothetical protein
MTTARHCPSRWQKDGLSWVPQKTKKTAAQEARCGGFADDLNQDDQNEICTPAMKVRAAPGTTMF